MGRGGAIYLSYTALVLLSAASTASAISDLWAVSIDEGPAPSPEDGPPFSAHATRNRALLPYQIIGIVGSYVATVFILGTLLLTVGRALRKRAQIMALRPTEMVKPMGRAFDPSPISPLSSSGRSWYSPRKLKSKRSANGSIRSGVSNPVSPAMDSVVSFDVNVVEADRQQRQEEMERLYAAVMAQDDRKSQAATITTSEVQPIAPPQYSQKRAPPRLVTDAPALRHLQVEAPQWSPHSPSTPKSPIRAIYPPDSPMPPMPSSPTSPLRAEYPTTPLTPQFFNDPTHRSHELRPTREARASSFGSTRSFASNSTSAAAAGGKKIRKSLRRLKISAPIQQGDDNSDGARTPLSPRFYTDPGIPPEPPTARTIDSQYQPITPGAASTKSWRYGEEHNTEDEQMDEVRDLPQPHPNRMSAYNYNSPAQAITNAASTRPDPTAVPTIKVPVASGHRPLPLRQLAAQQSQQQSDAYAAAHPLSPMTWNKGYPLSAGPVKTTFLDAKKDRLGAPRTGLATPYSPYMPYTPLTPVTPHLTSRAERRQRQKEDRKVHGVITEEDQVADEKDLWSSGY
ncbi:hypothetical protein LTR85_007261 [Meristemomyces frigidus]|nr:hypothetical protein LTR85_007261 [Meristemomyces frigidus]